MARFLAPSGSINPVSLVRAMRQYVPEYSLLNGLQVSSMLGHLASMVDGKHEAMLEDLNLEDDDSVGVLSFDRIMRYWNYSGYPKLDDELIEFLELMAVHTSNSLSEVDFKAFCRVFDPEFIMDASSLEDHPQFVPTALDDDAFLAQEMGQSPGSEKKQSID